METINGFIIAALTTAIASCSTEKELKSGNPDYIENETGTTSTTGGTTNSPTGSTTSTTSGSANLVKIAVFNGDVFGVAKMSNNEVANIFAKIIQRYDVLLLLEVRDSSGTSITDLLTLVNKSESTYSYIASNRLGRTSSKEQYVFFYKTSKLAVAGQNQSDDPGDFFEREPFTVSFKSGNNIIALLAIHVKPTDAINELDRLDEEAQNSKTALNPNNLFIIGDLNADCSYLSDTEYSNLDMVKNSNFSWFIGNDTDTTTSSTDCAYDRIIGFNSTATAAKIFDFKSEYVLSESTTSDVSNHFPVEFSVQL